MNIQDATRLAISRGGYIARAKFPVAIKPTDTPDCCIGYCRGMSPADKLSKGRRWQPQADDLLADDWRVIQSVDEVYTK